MATDRRWIIAGAIEILVAVGLILALMLSLWKGNHDLDRKRLHQLTLVTLLATVALFADFHGATGYGWRAFLVVCNVAVTLLAETGLYVCYVFASAQYSANNQGTQLPRWFAPSFRMVAFLCAMSQVIGVSLTIATDDYTYGLLLHVPISLVCMSASGLLAFAVWRLKTMLSSLDDVYDYLDPIAQNSMRVQANLTRVLLVLVPISMLGMASAVTLSLQTVRVKKSYSQMLSDANAHYSMEDDIISDWSILAFEFFFVFYVTSNNGTCEALFSLPMADVFPADSKVRSRHDSIYGVSRVDHDRARINSEIMQFTGGEHGHSSEAILRDFPEEIDEG